MTNKQYLTFWIVIMTLFLGLGATFVYQLKVLTKAINQLIEKL